MSTLSYTKAQKREIRRLVGLAHERALGKAMEDLHSEFERWRKGELDVFALNELIHKFHNETSRNLYKFYVMSIPDFSLAAAVSQGIIQETEVDPEILHLLRHIIQVAWQAESEVEEP